jgi:hypothetical protein
MRKVHEINVSGRFAVLPGLSSRSEAERGRLRDHHPTVRARERGRLIARPKQASGTCRKMAIAFTKKHNSSRQAWR